MLIYKFSLLGLIIFTVSASIAQAPITECNSKYLDSIDNCYATRFEVVKEIWLKQVIVSQPTAQSEMKLLIKHEQQIQMEYKKYLKKLDHAINKSEVEAHNDIDSKIQYTTLRIKKCKLMRKLL